MNCPAYIKEPNSDGLLVFCLLADKISAAEPA